MLLSYVCWQQLEAAWWKMSAAVGVLDTTALSDHDLMVPWSFGQKDFLNKSQPVLSRDAPTNTFALCRSLAYSGGELHKKFDDKHLAAGTRVLTYPAHLSITLWAAEKPIMLQIQLLERRGTLSSALGNNSRSCAGASGGCPHFSFLMVAVNSLHWKCISATALSRLKLLPSAGAHNAKWARRGVWGKGFLRKKSLKTVASWRFCSIFVRVLSETPSSGVNSC